jgi:hypothetical protein
MMMPLYRSQPELSLSGSSPRCFVFSLYSTIGFWIMYAHIGVSFLFLLLEFTIDGGLPFLLGKRIKFSSFRLGLDILVSFGLRIEPPRRLLLQPQR